MATGENQALKFQKTIIVIQIIWFDWKNILLSVLNILLLLLE